MLVKEAKEEAYRWVMEEGIRIPKLRGAFLHGSINWLSDDAVFPEDSDLDIMLVIDAKDPGLKLGKFVYHDILLEVSFLPKDEIDSADKVLGAYHLAGSFRAPSILFDPYGELTAVHKVAAKEFAARRWVEQRCRNAMEKILEGCRQDPDAPFPQQVNSWLFPTGITTHVLLTAGLKNPTVRRRYMAVRSLLAEYGRLDFHEELLALLGCGSMSRIQVGSHLLELTEVFDIAKKVQRTPFFFSSDLTDAARHLVIDASWKMISSGYHREAVFWITATYVRCIQVLSSDGTEEQLRRADRGFRRLLADLGVEDTADLQQRIADLKAALPRVWQTAEAIMDANPEIED